MAIDDLVIRIYPDGTGSVYPLLLGLDNASNFGKATSDDSPETSEHIKVPEATKDLLFHTDRVDAKYAKKLVQPLSRVAKRKLRSGYTALCEYYPHGYHSFFTGTLPRFEDRIMQRIEQGWAKICDLFKQKVCYHLETQGIEPLITYKTEYQQDGTLHIHMLCPGKIHNHQDWAIGKTLWLKLWKESIENVVPDVRDGVWDWSCRVEAATPLTGEYMAKYLCKDEEYIKTRESFVRQHWGCTRRFNKWFKSRVVELRISRDGISLWQLHDILETCEGILYSFPIVSEQYGIRCVAFRDCDVGGAHIANAISSFRRTDS